MAAQPPPLSPSSANEPAYWDPKFDCPLPRKDGPQGGGGCFETDRRYRWPGHCPAVTPKRAPAGNQHLSDEWPTKPRQGVPSKQWT